MGKGEMQPWAKQISEIASHENVVVKVSGLFTEANWSDWNQKILQNLNKNCFGQVRQSEYTN